MRERTSLLHIIKHFKRCSEYIRTGIFYDVTDEVVEAMHEIHNFVFNGCEYDDLDTADTKKATKYQDIFDLLYNEEEDIPYKTISEILGGVNVKKAVAKFNRIAIGKVRKMAKSNRVYQILLDIYFRVIKNL